MNVKAPWYNVSGDIPVTLEYPDCSMFEAVKKTAETYPAYVAYDFMGKRTSYAKALNDIIDCARGLLALGVRENDRVTICLPNSPQAVSMFYAVNLIGAVSNMIHPLSGEKEILFYLNESQSVTAITLDQVYGKFASILKDAPSMKSLIITSVKDALGPFKKLGYKLTDGRKITPLPRDADIVLWRDFIKDGAAAGDPAAARAANDPAVILYSGGTTGITKGVLLSNLNFNALARQVINANPIFSPGDKMLAIMPMFHGFGLGISIHTMLASGGHCVLVPRFTSNTYADLLRKHKPNFIAGVPTLFEALLRIPGLEDLDLSCLKGVFSGGDTLSVGLKQRFDAFLGAHNASVVVREGYGTTECVTASCITPTHMAREGSIGIPLADTFYKIVRVDSEEELPCGEEGEICISGPTVMLEYLNNPEETKKTLRRHADGKSWVHTGDLGVMDSDGFIYFRQRIKRMIITSGYNVYPSQLENILDAHDCVHLSCVIGVKDLYKMQKVKAFIVLKPGYAPSEELKRELLEHCSKNMAKYAVPQEIEFRSDLPKTLVGKVHYRLLEEEELRRASGI